MPEKLNKQIKIENNHNHENWTGDPPLKNLLGKKEPFLFFEILPATLKLQPGVFYKNNYINNEKEKRKQKGNGYRQRKDTGK